MCGSDRKPVIVATILALMIFSFIIITTGPDEVLFIGVGTAEAPSSLPTIVFYVCGAVIGAAGGPLQAASRTMLVRQAGEERMTEAFGLYGARRQGDLFRGPPSGRIRHRCKRQPARRRHADTGPLPRRPGPHGLGARRRRGGPSPAGLNEEDPRWRGSHTVPSKYDRKAISAGGWIPNMGGRSVRSIQSP